MTASPSASGTGVNGGQVPETSPGGVYVECTRRIEYIKKCVTGPDPGLQLLLAPKMRDKHTAMSTFDG